MPLKFFQFGFLLLVQMHEVTDKVQEVPRRNVVEFLGGLHELDVEVTDGCVDLDDAARQEFSFRIDAFVVLAVLNRVVSDLNRLGETIGRNVDILSELLSDLKKAIVGPVTEPINYAPVEQRRR